MVEQPMTNAPAAAEQPVAAPSATTYTPPPAMESVAQPNLTQGNLPAYGEPGAPAQPSTVVPAGAPAAQPAAAPPKHAHLLAMVQGLADGLSAAGTSIATHGREGGAPQVQEQRIQRQQAQQSAERAQQEKAAQALDLQIKTQDLTHITNATNKIVLDTLPDLVAQSHMKTAEAQTGLAQAQFGLFAGTGMNPQQIDALVSGKTPIDAKTSNMLQVNAQQGFRIASQILPSG